jgi:hypothetical protein
MRSPSSKNKTLIEILKNFNTEMQTVPTFDQYYPEARPRYVLEEKKKRGEGFKVQLKALEDSYRSQAGKKLAAIDQLRNGNLINENYSSSSLRQIATTEFNTAVMLANSKPENIDQIIKLATGQKRHELIFSLENLFNGRDDLSNAYKTKLQFAFQAAKEKLGYTQLENEHKELTALADETAEFNVLLETDVDGFAKEAGLSVRVQNQLEKFHPELIEGEAGGND